LDIDGTIELNAEDAVESDAGEVVDIIADHVRIEDEIRPAVYYSCSRVQPRVSVCSRA